MDLTTLVVFAFWVIVLAVLFAVFMVQLLESES